MSNMQELVCNFNVNDQKILTRREVLMMGALAATSIATPVAALGEASVKQPAGGETYVAKDFTYLISQGMSGFSASQIEQHLKLYKGYVAKANEIESKLKDVDISVANATYAPLRELLVEQSFALNGVIYHELYFSNLGGHGGEPEGAVRQAIEDNWGTTGKFMDYLKASGKCMRGWVILGWNTRTSSVHCYGLDMHNMWVPQGVIPLLVLDVYEHAYMIDYGIDRAKYLDAFANNLNWGVVAKRFASASKHHTSPECAKGLY